MNQFKLIVGLSMIAAGTSFAQQVPATQQTQQVNPQTAYYPYQNGQLQRVSTAPQQLGNLPQATQKTSVPAGTNNGSQAILEGEGTVTTIMNEDGTPIVIDGQGQNANEASVQKSDATPDMTQTSNNGMVPKVYINTEEVLPFRQYQPKPTGQISSSTNQSTVPTRRRP